MTIDAAHSGEEQLGHMLPNHHIDDDMLLAYAAGTLSEAASVVMAAHLSLCPQCRTRLAAAEAVGGALLDDITLVPGMNVASILDRLDAPEAPKPQKAPAGDGLLPRPVRDYISGDMKTLQWKFVQPGVRFAELLVDDTGARMGLMRTQPGAAITPHGHSGDELTLVLSGGYRCDGQGYRRGDLQSVDENITHELTTDLDGECLSLVMIRGPIRPKRWIARILRHLTDF